MPTLCKTCVKIAHESTLVPPPKIKQALFNIPGSKAKFCQDLKKLQTPIKLSNNSILCTRAYWNREHICI